MSQRGFTLLEVLVALMVAGMVLTVFMQLLSGSLRLEFKSRQRLEAVDAAKEIFDDLLRRDVNASDFPWTGSDGPYSWHLTVGVLESPTTDRRPGDSNLNLQLRHELQRYSFEFFEDGRPSLHFVLYKMLTVDTLDSQSASQPETPTEEPQEQPEAPQEQPESGSPAQEQQ